MGSGTVHYKYAFRLADGSQKTFDVALDARTMAVAQPERKTYPPWTALSSNQCPNCPLSTETTAHCPIAVSLVDSSIFLGRHPRMTRSRCN